MIGGVASDNGSTLLAGGVGYVLGAPIAHLANGYPSHAAGSLGIRVLSGGIATGAVLMDILSHPCDGEPSCQHYPSAGLALATVTLLAGAAIDDAWLARTSVKTQLEHASVQPGIAFGPNLAFLSLGGRFW